MHRTTSILLLIALVCVAVELPQGILAILTASLGDAFMMDVYNPLGDFFELLTVVYSSTNFALYCLMSSGFRRACMVTPITAPSARVDEMTGSGAVPAALGRGDGADGAGGGGGAGRDGAGDAPAGGRHQQARPTHHLKWTLLLYTLRVISICFHLAAKWSDQ